MKKIFTKHFLLSSLSIIGVMVLVLMPHIASAEGLVDAIIWGTNFFYGWGARILHFLVVTPLSWILTLVGAILDFGIKFSMNSTGILNDESITTGWKVIRDVCNLGFIFALIAFAISTILETTGWFSSYNGKKKLIAIIVAATLMNFSLYFTKVVIDVSNVAASWFYNATLSLVPGESVGSYGIGEKSLSFTLVSTLKMGKLFDIDKPEDSSTFLVAIALIVLNVFAIKMLWGIAFLFIGRGISFVVLLLTSPIYVMSFVLPALKEQGKKWQEELTKNAMLAPMFLLTLYVVLYFINSFYNNFITKIESLGKLDKATQTAFSYGDYVMFVIIYLLLKKCQEVAEEYSSDMAKMAGDGLKNAATFVAGYTGMRVGGKLASKFLKTETSKRLAGSWVGEQINAGVGGIASADMGVSSSLKGLGLGNYTGQFGGGKGDKGLNTIREDDKKREIERERARTATAHRQNISSSVPVARNTAEQLNAPRNQLSTSVESLRIQRNDLDLAQANEQAMADAFNANPSTANANAYTQAQAQTTLLRQQVANAETRYNQDRANYDTAQSAHDNSTNDIIFRARQLTNEQLKSLDKSILSDPQFIEALSTEQVKYIADNTNKTDSEKQQLWNLRLLPLTNALQTGDSEIIQKTLKKFSADEILELDIDTLNSLNTPQNGEPELVSVAHMDYDKYKKILEGKKIDPITKKVLKDARYAAFEKKVANGTAGDVQKMFKGFANNAIEVANLDAKIIKDAKILPLLTVRHLEQMLTTLSGGDRQTIKAALQQIYQPATNGQPSDPITKWFESGKGLTF